MKTIKVGTYIICIISVFCVFVNCFSINSSILLSLIPLCYLICVKFIVPNKIVIGAGYVMLSIVSILRYTVYPVLCPYDDISTQDAVYLIPSILITIFEMVVIHLVIRWFYKKHRYNKNVDTISINKISPVIPILLFFYWIVVIMLFPTIYANRHFILDASNISAEKLELPGIIAQPMKWVEIFLIVFMFSRLYQYYKSKGSKLAYYGSLFVIMIPCLFYSGHSRLSLLMPLICTIFMIMHIYGAKSRKLIWGICIYAFLAISVLSMFKFYGDSSLETASTELSYTENAGLINAYFGGLKNMMIGLRAYDEVGSSLSIIPNDLLRNCMGISDMFASDHNSVSIFNRYFYNSTAGFNDQICPTLIEGLFTFGPLGCFIPTIIMIWFVCWLDYKWNSSMKLEYSYLYAYVATLIGWCIPGNFMHLSGTFFNIYVPLMFLFILNSKFQKMQ